MTYMTSIYDAGKPLPTRPGEEPDDIPASAFARLERTSELLESLWVEWLRKITPDCEKPLIKQYLAWMLMSNPNEEAAIQIIYYCIMAEILRRASRYDEGPRYSGPDSEAYEIANSKDFKVARYAFFRKEDALKARSDFLAGRAIPGEKPIRLRKIEVQNALAREMRRLGMGEEE